MERVKEQVKTPLKNKIIYTTHGWGVSDGPKKQQVNMGTSSNLSTSRKDEKFRKSKNSPKSNTSYGAPPKSNKFVNVNSTEGRRVIQTGNQRLIIPDKSNNMKTSGKKDDWLGKDAFESDSSGEWVQQR